jgi:hypothetical protein
MLLFILLQGNLAGLTQDGIDGRTAELGFAAGSRRLVCR